MSVGGGYAFMQDNNDRKVAHIGASVTPIKALKLKAHYVMLDDDLLEADASMIAIGVDYNVAKNLSVYVAYSATTNDADVNYSATNWGHGQSALGAGNMGDDPSAFSLGVIYTFGVKL